MKAAFWLAVLFVAICLGSIQAQAEDKPPLPTANYWTISPAKQFIFFAVLEGLYEDGVSTDDVQQILLKKDGHGYYHFIYACPICESTIWALEAYSARPKQFHSLKRSGSTFGPGLTKELHDQLYSTDSNQRLMAINTLTKNWLARRLSRSQFNKKERTELLAELEELRKEGMRILKNFKSEESGPNAVAGYAPAYVDLEECAVCNGAVGKLMKLPEK